MTTGIAGDKPLTGLVLAGGRSTRMGRDKAVLDVDGAPLLAGAVNMLKSFCPSVWVSGRNPADLGLDLPWVPDEKPCMGPMVGIVSALARLDLPLLVLPLDLPLMDPGLVARLVRARRERPQGTDLTIFRERATGLLEPLVAVYEPSAEPGLRRSLKQGWRGLALALSPGARWHLDYGADEADCFLNVNRPQDLDKVLRILSRTRDKARA